MSCINKSALIIGPYDETGKEKFAGQGIKLLNLYSLLENFYLDISILSTYKIKKKPLFWYTLYRKVKKHDDIWLVVSRNGTKLILPFLTKCFPSKRIFYANVGIGCLLSEVSNNANPLELTDYLRDEKQWEHSKNNRLCLAFQKCKLVFLESPTMVNNFKIVYGCQNARYLPNFRNNPIHDLSGKQRKKNTVIYFGRIAKAKGLDDLIHCALCLPEIGIDIYGPIQPGEEEWAGALLKNAPNNIRFHGNYKGDAINLISDYEALVFPSRSFEGMPGAVIESILASTPVISSRFTYAEDIITDNKNGLIYPFLDENGLLTALDEFLSFDETKKMEMRKEAFLKSADFGIDSVRKLLETLLS